jgi:hypothetical protein
VDLGCVVGDAWEILANIRGNRCYPGSCVCICEIELVPRTDLVPTQCMIGALVVSVEVVVRTIAFADAKGRIIFRWEYFRVVSKSGFQDYRARKMPISNCCARARAETRSPKNLNTLQYKVQLGGSARTVVLVL